MAQTAAAQAPAKEAGASATHEQPAGNHRWWILAIIGVAQLMVVLDATIVSIALPSAQADLGFSDGNRTWIVTAYSLAFGSLLLLGGRIADLFGRKIAFLVGVGGFAAASALAGAAQNFETLVAGRALQGAFGALLAPAALSLLTTTFTDPKERAKAFGVFGAIGGSGAAMGLLLGGVLTEYLNWRSTLYVNLLFAAVALFGGWTLLKRADRDPDAKLDIPGTLLVTLGLFGIVYGFSNAESHDWTSPLTIGFLAGRRHPPGRLRLVADPRLAPAAAAARAARPQPGRVLHRDAHRRCRNVRRLPFPHLLPAAEPGLLRHPDRLGLPAHGRRPDDRRDRRHEPAAPAGQPQDRRPDRQPPGRPCGMVWLTPLDMSSTYVANVLPPLLVIGLGIGLVFAPSMSLATAGVAAEDAGVASALVNTMQQIGGSIGTPLFNTLAASAATSYLVGKDATSKLVQAQAQLEAYSTAYWWAAGFFAVGAVLTAILFRPGVPEADPEAAAAVHM